ncbi:MAG TPA: hypothetical protein VHF90_10505 [Thermoleophilaceae bacterium]|nr:hypothetical protein [Thermoleophilaceae bacterium]
MSPGQGSTVRQAAELLRQADWDVAYTCVPNRPYIGVVAIPVPSAGGRERYPDVVAGRGAAVALVEVEPRLSADVAREIARRLGEQRAALQVPDVYASWRRKVHQRTGVLLAADPQIELHLLVARPIAAEDDELVGQLAGVGIAASDPAAFAVAVSG